MSDSNKVEVPAHFFEFHGYGYESHSDDEVGPFDTEEERDEAARQEVIEAIKEAGEESTEEKLDEFWPDVILHTGEIKEVHLLRYFPSSDTIFSLIEESIYGEFEEAEEALDQWVEGVGPQEHERIKALFGRSGREEFYHRLQQAVCQYFQDAGLAPTVKGLWHE